jgi:steroid delta-isomerase-like uncharacterized protein
VKSTKIHATDPKEEQMSNADVLAEMVEAFVAHDYDRVAATLSHDCTFDDVASGVVATGRDGVLEEFKKWETGFPDMDISALSVVSTDTGAAGEFLARGTQSGPLGEIPPTGKPVEARFSLIAEIEDGHITGMREYYDAMTLMTQLGVVPSGAEA